MHIRAEAAPLLDLSSDLVAELVEPPSDGPGVCPACRTWMPSSATATLFECENCTEVREALGVPAMSCAVVSLYRKPSQLRDWFTHYKGREGAKEAELIPEYFDVVRAIVGRFLLDHAGRLTSLWGEIDAVAVVPSTDRPPPHPLEQVLCSLDLDVPIVRPLERGDGDLGFRRPNRNGFRTVGSLDTCNILLLDDVYTTGARINSAAVALSDAGHRVVGGLVLARRINPEYSTEAGQLWESATKRPFDWIGSPWIPT